MVIPARGAPDLLGETLEHALLACSELDEPWEVIVIVNGSPASLYAAVAGHHKHVVWLYSEKPLWYCGAVRRGIQAARYDWVYLLNSDMFLDRLALKTLMPWRSPNVFAIASQVFFRDPERRREETGWTMFRSTGGPIEILDAAPEDDCAVRGTYYAGGGASLFRRDLLQDLIRGSSVYLPFYWEDVEWGTRAWRRGYESLFCPASKAWHLHRFTNRLFFHEAEIERILRRNRFVFHLRNGAPVGAFPQFLRELQGLDAQSLNEILQWRRLARIATGRFQTCRLPADHLPLDRTWHVRYETPARGAQTTAEEPAANKRRQLP